jgi:ligand-binding sensor domain-containing protein
MACLTGAWGLPAIGQDAWKHYTRADGLPSDEIQFIKQDAGGSVWVGTLSGLAVFRDGKFTPRITDTAVWDVLPAGKGQYWVGTDSGVVRLDGEKKEAGVGGQAVAKIFRYDRETLWALGKSGGIQERCTILQNSGGTWMPVSAFSGIEIADLFQTADGAMWITVEADGVWVVNPRDGISKAVSHLKGLNVRTVYQDSQSRVWCGVWGRGVMVFEQDAWTRHLTREKSDILAIREDAGHRIWVATSGSGVWRYEKGQWTPYLAEEGAINLLETTSDGRVWISSQKTGGLRCWTAAGWMTALDGGQPMRCLIETGDKRIWAGCVYGGIYVR